MNFKEMIKRLISNELTFEQEQDLLNHPSVLSQMQKEWSAPTFAGSEAEADFIWGNIYRRTIGKLSCRKMLFLKVYGVAATILLLVAVAFYISGYYSRAEVMFVATCGRQTVDSIFLSDGSKVILSANSRIAYPRNFTGKDRRVTLSGQAFFSVAKDATKPFIVETSMMQVTALGTEFEVFSYGNEGAETILLSGKVKVQTPDNGKEPFSSIVLLPDSKFSVSSDGKIRVEQVNAGKYSVWRKKGRLSFENEPLSMIIPRVEKWYGCRIYCDSVLAQSHRFTFTVNDESLESLLDMIEKISPLSCVNQGENYRIIYRR